MLCRIAPQEILVLILPSRMSTHQSPPPHQRNRITSSPRTARLPPPHPLPLPLFSLPHLPKHTPQHHTTPLHTQKVTTAFEHSPCTQVLPRDHRVLSWYGPAQAPPLPPPTRKVGRKIRHPKQKRKVAVTMWTLAFLDRKRTQRVADHHQGLPQCMNGREEQAILVKQSTVLLERLLRAMCTHLWLRVWTLVPTLVLEILVIMRGTRIPSFITESTCVCIMIIYCWCIVMTLCHNNIFLTFCSWMWCDCVHRIKCNLRSYYFLL